MSVITSAKIALDTRFNVHPDEYVHADAFCYFERHWWPPELNSSEVVYSPQGWSRVYDGELVYLVYGRIARLIHPIVGPVLDAVQQSAWSERFASVREVRRVFLPLISGAHGCPFEYQVYRLLNVFLYAVTLLVLFLVGRKHALSAVIGLLLLSIPQVTYVYSYANSDAWGLSVSLLLFVFALTRRHRLVGSWWNLMGLGVLTGLVLLAKKPYWLLLPFVYVPLGWSLVREIKGRDDIRVREVAVSLAFLLATSLVVLAPFRIVYPLTQGSFGARAEEMREVRAREGWKPSDPTDVGYRLSSKGVPFRAVWADPYWINRSAESFYGLFGYMTVRSPQWVYFCAAAIALLCSLCTIGFAVRHWNQLPSITRILLILLPPIVALNVLASMYNSWTHDFQPQGRYLFPLLLPLALLIGGTIEFEPRWLRTIRVLGILAMSILSLYVLWSVVLQDTGLRF